MQSIVVYYAAVIAAIAALFIFKQAFRTASNFFFLYIRQWCLANLVYPQVHLRLFGIKLVLQYRLIFPFAFFVGTGICNAVGIHSISEAGVRAAHISLITLLLLCWTGDHEFGARLLGVDLATYQSLHRISALMAIIQAAIHVIIASQQTHFSTSDSSQFYGLLAACMFLSLFLLPMVKRRVYELFLRTHQGCAIFALYTLWRHVSSSQSRRWVFLLAILCAVTGALQFVRILYRNITRRKSVRFITDTCGADALRVTLLLPQPWEVRAGERIYLSIPKVGLLYMFRPHPFTITWWEDDKNGGTSSISSLIRARSGFTKKLLDRLEPGCEGWAWIDGPYGPSSASVFGYSSEVGDYGHILMVATGMGIVAQLPYMKELLEGNRRAKVRTRRISLVWQLEHEGDWELARDFLQALVKQDDGYMLKVTVYNKMGSPSEAPGAVGHHALIAVYGGEVNWKDELFTELEQQIGTLLVTVSARHSIRKVMRNLVNQNVRRNVELYELEFQPWEKNNDWLSLFRPKRGGEA